MRVEVHQKIDAEALIRSGLLFFGDREFPAKLAKFLHQPKRPNVFRRFRRPGVLGNIDGVNNATQSNLNLGWDVQRSTSLPNVVRATGPNTAAVANYRQAVQYSFGSTGAGTINQVAQRTTTIGTSATSNIDMVTWAFNVIGDASATFSAIRELWIELLTVAQGGGASATSVTMGNHATNAWAGVLNATGQYTLKSGGLWLIQDQTTAAIAVAAGDLLKTVNADASNAASLRMTAVGYK